VNFVDVLADSVLVGAVALVEVAADFAISTVVLVVIATVVVLVPVKLVTAITALSLVVLTLTVFIVVVVTVFDQPFDGVLLISVRRQHQPLELRHLLHKFIANQLASAVTESHT